MIVKSKYLAGLAFEFQTGKHSLIMDTKPPLGQDLGPSPKEMLLASIAGCSGMDVAALLRKHHLSPTSLEISASGEARPEHPRIFSQIDLIFSFQGQDLDSEIIKNSVYLSMTQYCGVSAMVCQTTPIFYTVYLNGDELSQGRAKFS